MEHAEFVVVSGHTSMYGKDPAAPKARSKSASN